MRLHPLGLGLLAASMLLGPLRLAAEEQESSSTQPVGSSDAEAARVFLAEAESAAGVTKLRLLLKAGDSLAQAARLDDALDAYDRLAQASQSRYWEQVALIRKARACVPSRPNDALSLAAQYEATYPESSLAVEAQIVRLSVNGFDATMAARLRERERLASAEIGHAQALLKQARHEDGLARLRIVVTQYAGRPAALRASDTLGHALCGQGQNVEATRCFRQIVDTAAPVAPRAQVVARARLRLAALYHASGDRAAAASLYDEVKSQQGAGASRAALQLGGVVFEVLQHDQIPATADWVRLRDLLNDAVESEYSSPAEKVRAELMLVEAYAWQDGYAGCLSAANAFTSRQDVHSISRQDLATAHCFAGHAAYVLRDYPQSVQHFRRVIEYYPTEEAIWPGMDHLPRALYQVWESLTRMGAPAEEVGSAEAALKNRFPESPYNVLLSIQKPLLRTRSAAEGAAPRE